MSLRSEIKVMACHSEVNSKRKEVAAYEILCFTIETMREMLCFTIETAVGGREGRRCPTAVAVMFACGRLWSGRSAIGKCNCRLLDSL